LIPLTRGNLCQGRRISRIGCGRTDCPSVQEVA
jgi:hypothetical protein